MNLQDLRARVRRLSGIRLTELLPDSDLNQLINEAHREIAALRQWPFLRASFEETLTDCACVIELPTSVRLVTGVVLGGGATLRQVTLPELDRLPDEVGEPLLYARVDDSSLRVWPAPRDTTNFLIRVQQQPPGLVNNGDTPVFEEEFHPVLAYMVASRVLAEEGDDSGRSQMYGQEAGAIIARMDDRYLSSQDAGFFVLGGDNMRRRRAGHI